jgi:hypothetical protein
MTQDEIILLADASGISLYGMGLDREKFIYYLEAFAKLVAQHEREACAKIAEYKLDDKGLTAPDSPKEWWNHACKNIRDAIRARTES